MKKAVLLLLVLLVARPLGGQTIRLRAGGAFAVREIHMHSAPPLFGGQAVARDVAWYKKHSGFTGGVWYDAPFRRGAAFRFGALWMSKRGEYLKVPALLLIAVDSERTLFATMG